MAKSQILVLGGGVGGTLVANLLAKKLKRSEADITVIDKDGRHVYQPGFLYVPFGWEKVDSLVKCEEGLLNSRVNLLTDTATFIDTDRGEVSLAGGRKVDYDYLVVATGSIPSPEQVPGLKEAGHHFYTRQGALQMKEALDQFDGGRVVIGVAGLPYKCPVAPLEFAFLLDWYLERKGIRDKAELEYVSPLPRCFPIRTVSDMATPLLEDRGVRIHTFFNVEEVDPEKRIVKSLEGQEREFDLLMLIPPHRGAQVLIDSGLAKGPGGWVPTDRYSLKAEEYDNIYVVGDATDLAISKSGSAAHFEADVLVDNLVSEVRGKAPEHEFDGHVMCFLETGNNRASLLDFDYNNPPLPPEPSVLLHYAKIAFNKTYWWTLPQGRLPNRPVKPRVQEATSGS